MVAGVDCCGVSHPIPNYSPSFISVLLSPDVNDAAPVIWNWTRFPMPFAKRPGNNRRHLPFDKSDVDGIKRTSVKQLLEI